MYTYIHTYMHTYITCLCSAVDAFDEDDLYYARLIYIYIYIYIHIHAYIHYLSVQCRGCFR